MWCIGVEEEQETSAPPPKKNPGSAPVAPLKIKSLNVLGKVYSSWHSVSLAHRQQS